MINLTFKRKLHRFIFLNGYQLAIMQPIHNKKRHNV